ncbi:hypothetical protein BU16DRAFT_496352 [Lophium mytilinum]|uniref:Protein kinase domain-containing protein n=1 Tax=Lophium mytilinum TaxID=390894 RepID=A0A6A6QB82_9PEZI|nr:hypothetical protein BU16DRAFT_496352 [Lophium mytilinum]
MDLFSTSLEIISLIYETTVFIREVTAEIKEYGSAKRDISERLEHELVFVETFTDVCFGEERGLLRDSRVRDSVKRDVQHCLDALSQALGAYRVEASKFAGVVPEIAGDAKDMDAGAKKKWKFGNGMRTRCQTWRKKASPLEWALFGKEAMEALLLHYTEWTDRLRQTLSIILLLVGNSTPGFAASSQAVDLGVKEVSERQIRVHSQPPENYDALDGDMKDPVILKPKQELLRGVYEDKSGFDSMDVIVEIRQYDDAIALATSERDYDGAKALKEPLRRLTWLLQGPVDSDLSKQDAEEGYRMHTLSCLGFLDEPSKNRSLLLYRSPQVLLGTEETPTLHALIVGRPKLTLGGRFRTARALAATLLTIHTSGWVHKNICSRSVLMLPGSSNDLEKLPYLVGWDVARPLEASTSLHELFDLEPNLYHHQQRFGKPTHKFSNEHDIYSLGVLLLEIGLWKTMSTVFARPLEKNPRIDSTQQHTLFQRVSGMIGQLAAGSELKQEMGEGYAGVVQKCLSWRPNESQEDAVELSIDFRKQVVDALSKGSKL